MSVNFAPPPHLHLVGRREKRYILQGAARAAGKREEAARTTMGPPLVTTRGRHWPMVPALNSGAKFPKSPQPNVVWRAVPRWTSELDETGSWSPSRSRSRPASAASFPSRSRPASATSLPSAARPRSAHPLSRGATGDSAQAVPFSERDTSGLAARPARPASAASFDSSASRATARSEVQPASPEQLLREYRGWKSGELEWQAPPAELYVTMNKMPTHSSRCMCSGCLGYRPHGLTRLLGAAYS